MPHATTQTEAPQNRIETFIDILGKVMCQGSTPGSMQFDLNALNENDLESFQEIVASGFTLKAALMALSRMPALV